MIYALEESMVYWYASRIHDKMKTANDIDTFYRFLPVSPTKILNRSFDLGILSKAWLETMKNSN